MSIAVATVSAAVLTALAAAVTTLWQQRRNGPAAEASMLTASTLLLAQLQTRVGALEERVEVLEDENSRYHALYGPLPPL